MIKIGKSVILIVIFIVVMKCHDGDESGTPTDSNTCHHGAEYLKCGPICQKSCDPAQHYCRTVPTNGTCVSGCFCKGGLVLHRPTGTCVKQSQCNTTCQKNMEYKKCGTACPATCKRPNATVCSGKCREGCFCKANLVLEVQSGKCIRPDQCLAVLQCPKYMVYQDCGPVFPLTCFPMPYNEIYEKGCSEGCFCQNGYLLYNRTCVKVEDCPRMNCPPDMVYQECVKDCPPTCRHRSSKENCFQECAKGCVCKEGLVYNKNKNLCVKVEECTTLCPENMKFEECGNACPPTCDNPVATSACNKTCVKGCQCLEGMVLDTRSGTHNCILLEDCSKQCPECAKLVYGHE